MTLTWETHARVAIAVAILASIFFFGGNQRQIHAAVPPDLGQQIFCFVFTELNTVGPPVNLFSADCKNPPGAPPQCSDGIDNDGDGLVDYPADLGCTSKNDNTEAPNPPPPPAPQCSDGIDNDGDGLIDATDPGCHSDGNASNTSSYDASDTSEANAAVPAQCADGIDNDGDSLIDLVDPGCSGADDNDETNTPGGGGNPTPQCSDGVDNDGDGNIDFPADSGCDGAGDDSENSEQANNNGGSSGGRSGGGGGGSRRVATPLPPGEVLGTEVCEEYLLEYIKFGAQNNANEVLKLQRFLRDLNGFGNLQETGVYDAATLEAVHEFQKMYAAQILTPWGATQSTGYVYLTTKKTINEIHCKFTKQFPLNSDQLAEIARVKAQGGAWHPSTPLSIPVGPTGIQLPPTVSAPSQDSGGDAKQQGVVGTSSAQGNGGSWWDNLRSWFFRP